MFVIFHVCSWINKVLIPNVKKTRLDINKSDQVQSRSTNEFEIVLTNHNKCQQVALLLVDVWHGHFDKKVLKLLAKNRIKVIPIEPVTSEQYLKLCLH